MNRILKNAGFKPPSVEAKEALGKAKEEAAKTMGAVAREGGAGKAAPGIEVRLIILWLYLRVLYSDLYVLFVVVGLK